MLNRLISNGFQAYLVGGSVRDLLLHKAPKDFDVATNATPNQIRGLFKNARIIGRRFKLVHILFHREIIEVATFRGSQMEDGQQQVNERGMLIRDNVYGSIEEDAWRRDFSINSLYYNIEDSSLLDFTGGVHDIHQQTIKIIGDPDVRYQEDPVRMLRAIRFCAKLEFQLDPATEAPFFQHAHLISHISNSRLFDEMVKLYHCGQGLRAQELLVHYGLFELLFPQTHTLFSSDYPVALLLSQALESTDARIRDHKTVTPAFLFAVLLWFPMLDRALHLQKAGLDPLPSIEKAMSLVLMEQSAIISIPKRFTQVIREIWLLQYRFPKRQGERAHHLLEHPRFRAAYDFLALRALSGDENLELAQWWTTFQETSEQEQEKMIQALPPLGAKKRRRRNK